ncbi:group 1 glycosyl transferase [Moorena producens PAL-8-15-08-1]|uniref:Group 1 glycosyl transferase n=1 Tax=Moorena producens PAL-8-15-08-1 TaxID=1458985 RepID=A0A1D8TTM9_9CYAN|nr:glycosyltransferase family 4 protein [Moorena producens]AOX00999.1 group 1 glycosyl transferase [Moorena producens PAL-8-15-08-1]
MLVKTLSNYYNNSNSKSRETKKIIVIPAYWSSLGGMTVSLSLLIKGFQLCDVSEQLCVLVRADSLLERYLKDAGQESVIQSIPRQGKRRFLQQALQWVAQQPKDWPVLLDNLVWRSYLPILLKASPKLRLSQRPVYHFCHDLALSHNPFGYLARKVTFTCLAPAAICNSQFTANHVHKLMPDIRGILYQPVDTEQFNNKPPTGSPPENLQPILNSGARIMLTPSRLNQPGIVNDKNLRALIPVLAQLKAQGHFYHGVIIGEDKSPGQIHTRTLLESAEKSGVADRFTILPPTFAIEDYYKYADVVVSLAPREPFGRTVVEAIACGVPVVGSNTGGINEILQNFAPEWTVEPNDPMAAAETLVKVINSPTTPELLAKGNQWVETHCGVEHYAKGIMRITGLAPDS